MSDGIIDLTQYLHGGGEELPRGTFALWGADGERSRFALPLWRIIYLARGGRGVLLHRPTEAGGPAEAHVILDLTQDPPKMTLEPDCFREGEQADPPALFDREAGGLLIRLGSRRGKEWIILVDGAGDRSGPLEPTAREDILFLAGECAGLLFLKDLDAL